MADPSQPMQVAIAAALLASPAVTFVIADRVFDSLSARGAAYPFIEIGQNQIVPDNDGCMGLVTDYETLHIWADTPSGRLIAKTLATGIHDALTPDGQASPLAPAGFRVVSGIQQDARHGVDGDPTDAEGQVAHSTLLFRFRLQPTG